MLNIFGILGTEYLVQSTRYLAHKYLPTYIHVEHSVHIVHIVITRTYAVHIVHIVHIVYTIDTLYILRTYCTSVHTEPYRTVPYLT